MCLPRIRLALLLGLLSVQSTSAQPPSRTEEVKGWIRAASTYESGQSMQPLRQLEKLSREASNNPALRDAVENGLVELLAMPSSVEARQFACQQLALIGTDKSLPVLTDLLRSSNTVALACQALGAHPSARASDVLRTSLPSSTGTARIQIIRAIGERQDQDAVPSLALLARDADPVLASAAVAALGRIASTPALEALTSLQPGGTSALAETLREALMSAAEKLVAAGESRLAIRIYDTLLDRAQPDNVRRGAFEAALSLDADRGEGRILRTLRGDDALLKPVAISNIRTLPSASTSEKLAALLPGLTSQEQAWLIQSLAERPDSAARSAVGEALNAESVAVRVAAVDALAKTEGTGAVELLTRALSRRTGSSERAAISKALVSMRGGENVDKAIVAELDHVSDVAKGDLLDVLGKRANRVALPALLQAADDAKTAEAAFRNLGRLAEAEDLPDLIDKLVNLAAADARAEAENAVARAVGKAPDTAARSAVIVGRLGKASDLATRCSLLRILPACAGKDALDALRLAMDDPIPDVKDTAIRALAQWPTFDGWEPLLTAFQKAPSPAHRVVALDGLTRLAEDQNSTANPLRARQFGELMARVQTDDERRLVLGVMGSSTDPGVLELLFPLLSRPEVRAEAALALKKVAAVVEKDHPAAAAAALQKLR